MKKRFCLVLLSVVGVACNNTSSIGGVERNRGVVAEADGSFSYYAGRGIGDLITRGEVLSDDLPVSFMRLRVPAALVDAAAASPKRVKTVSFEISNPEIEAKVHRFRIDPVTKAQTLTNEVFHPGDPWLTGYAQVGADVDFMMGLFEIVRWSNDATGTVSPAITQQTYSTGLLPDDDLPVLKYNGDPAAWPAVPDHWK